MISPTCQTNTAAEAEYTVRPDRLTRMLECFEANADRDEGQGSGFNGSLMSTLN